MMRTQDLNHVALHVADLEASMEFYGETLGLELIERPAFDFPGAWYRLGEAQEILEVGKDVAERVRERMSA